MLESKQKCSRAHMGIFVLKSEIIPIRNQSSRIDVVINSDWNADKTRRRTIISMTTTNNTLFIWTAGIQEGLHRGSKFVSKRFPMDSNGIQATLKVLSFQLWETETPLSPWAQHPASVSMHLWDDDESLSLLVVFTKCCFLCFLKQSWCRSLKPHNFFSISVVWGCGSDFSFSFRVTQSISASSVYRQMKKNNGTETNET